ncbi:MAG: hypothetical protein ACRCZ9_00345 [Fusobacteriaceae bacterium]
MIKEESIYSENKEKLSNLFIKEAKDFVGEDIYKIIEQIGILEFVKDAFPVISTTWSFYQKIQMKKLEKFVKGIYGNENINFEYKITKDFIEKLYIVIDRIDYCEKIMYLTELYSMLTNDEITNSEFFRGCKILENTSIMDITDFYRKDTYQIAIDNGGLYQMLGFLESQSPEKGKVISLGDMGSLKLSKMGEVFLKIKEESIKKSSV